MNKSIVGDVSAKEINDEARLARTAAVDAVGHAIRAGQLLLDRQQIMRHGNFYKWIEKSCEFPLSTAKLYMRAADQKANALAFSSLRSLFPNKSRPAPLTFGAPKPFAPPTIEDEKETPSLTFAPSSKPEVSDESWQPDADEDVRLDVEIKVRNEAIDRVMDSDDKLGAAHQQIKQLSTQLATVTMSRDGFMNGKGDLTRLLKREQAKVARLEKRIEELETENEQLRERIAIQGEAA